MGLLSFAVAFVVSFALSYKATKDAQKQAKKQQDAMRGVLVNKESNIEPIPVVYGERRVGGVRVFVKASDDPTANTPRNEYLYMAFALCEGEVESISDIILDDKDISEFSGYDATGMASGWPTRRTVYQLFTGTDTQTVSTLLQEAGSEWTTDHRMRGVAYIAFRFFWDEDLFSGMPNITALVKGRKIFDPRTSTTAWSDNPALCIRDYLTNARFGKGLSSSAINDTAFNAAADDCDNFTVTPYSGGPTGVRLFRTNAVLDTGEELFRNVERMLLGCRGFLPYTQGQYALYIDQSASAVLTLTTNEIIGGISIAGERKNEMFNRVNIKFPNPNTDWEPDQATWPDAGSTEETTFQTEDGGILLVDEIDMETITDFYAARDFARIFVLRSRNALRCAFRATSEALDLTVGDVVNITHPTPGWTAKPFQVEEVSLGYDGTVELNCVEYDSTIYAYDLSPEETTYPDTNLPNPFDIDPPTNLQATATTRLADDGTVVPVIAVTWDAADNAFVSSYDVQWRRASDSTYNSYNTFELSHDIYNADVGQNYDIRVRSVGASGARSSFAAIQFTPTGDTTPPSIPTNLTAAAGLREIGLTWTVPPEKDYSHCLVYENTVNNSGTATQIAVAAGGNYTRTGLGYDETRYYWLKSVDFSGNVSGFSGVASATTDFVDTDAFTQSVYDIFSNANVNQIAIVSVLPGLASEGDVVYLTTDNKLYRYTGTQWTAAVPTSDLLGTITETQIADNSISTGKIQTNAITANEILGGTITGDKIVANTIEGGLLAAAGIITTAAQVEDAVIANAAIQNGAITNAKIGTAEVDTLKIDGNAVTVPEGTAGVSNSQLTTSWQIIDSITLFYENGAPPSAVLMQGFLSVENLTGSQQVNPQLLVTANRGTISNAKAEITVDAGRRTQLACGGKTAGMIGTSVIVTLQARLRAASSATYAREYSITAMGSKR